MTRSARLKLLTHLALIALVVLLAFPVYYALVTSTLTFREAYQYPPRLLPGGELWHNLQEAWVRAKFGRLFFNSTVISLVVAFVKIVLSLLAAFAYTHFRFRGAGFLFALSMITQMLPLPVRILPTYELMDRFHWINTYYALTVPFFASTTGILLFRQFYLTVPRELSDAARVDGAGPMRYFWQILVPLSRTNIAALFVIEFIFMWSQYLWPLIVTNTADMRVVQIGLKMLIASEQIAPEWNVIMAGTVIAMVPPLVVLIALRKSFAQGIAMQSEK
ncbi:carbohydrate ABC transporter permease [Oceanithermus desulfurans]|uniref:sn-glycerol-3-phosphate transport system permease protein UgpE n=2 Tax=Oceanithermus desulfurans TaxID=227924 RepID=A0A511RK47_9DEIN|nr:ABC transporter permease subunit [Oceanithermus desulfurans]MBB6029327.1 sn-glycerol 3-phosphate transport system permease protein [Oceanithermus desulfurans]GEM90018.1 sn-glycerol-3-phosphate transport system permease protein UgpE [Oceanithermus desulfurans NBRC 100063]